MAGFAKGPADSLAAAYDMTLRQVQLVKGYLQHLTATYVAPAFAANVLGPPLGPQSGGLLVARSVGDWLNGVCCCSINCLLFLRGILRGGGGHILHGSWPSNAKCMCAALCSMIQ